MKDGLMTYDLNNGIHLNILRERKFKTIDIYLFLQQELNQNSTKTALVPLVLRRGSKNYTTQKEIQVYLEELYGSSLSVGIIKKGERQIISLNLSIVNEKYVKEKDILRKAFEFLYEIIMEPVTEKGGFKKEYVKQEKENLDHIIRSLINDKGQYVIEKCFQAMCEHEKFSHYVYGNISDLKEIDKDSLYKFYQEIISTAPIDIFITGDIQESRIKEIVEEVFLLNRDKLCLIPNEIVKKGVGEEKEIVEELDVTQGKLALGFRTNTPYDDKMYFPLVVYSSILGGGPHSKLFINVREKASLAYYAYARLEKFKGLMIVSAGIEFDNYNKAVNIIKEQINDIKEGKITDYEFDSSKKAIITSLISSQDDSGQIVDYYLGNRIKQIDIPIFSFIENVKSVTPQQVVDVAQRVKLDTVYFLKKGKVGVHRG